MFTENEKVRLIVSPMSSSKENMATDEALLKCFNEENMTILRLYIWEEDSLTIGVSQDINNYNIDNKYMDKYAKRVTGGGVLFHGHDVSYSLVIPTNKLKDLSIKESYEMICTFLINFYKNLDLSVCYAKDDKNIQLSKSEYCQVGFEAYDILVNGKKIGGNAQRRTKKAIFQHGSIPVFGNNCSVEIGNTLEDFGLKLSFNEIINRLSDSFSNTFNVELIDSSLNKDELQTKELLLKEKYDYTTK